MYYYKRLKDLREDADKNQEDIARYLGTSQSQYSKYERGAREIPFHLAIKLAEYYDTSLDYIAGRTNEKK